MGTPIPSVIPAPELHQPRPPTRSRSAPLSQWCAGLLTAAYCLFALILYLHFGYWVGTEKVYLLAGYVLLFFPACFFLWRSCTAAPADGRASLPRIANTRLLLAVSAGALLVYAAFYNKGIELPDESVYHFEARTLQSGHLSVPAPSANVLADPDGKQAFRFTHELHYQGRWFGKYPIGYPAVLLVADRLGLDRMINPLLSCVLMAIAAWLAQTLFGEVIAQWTVVLFALSAFFVFNSMGWYAHNLTGVLVAAAAAAAVLSTRSPRPWLHLALAGLALALALFVHPFPVVLAGLVLAAYALVQHWRDRKTLVVGGLASCLIVGVAVFAYLFLQKQLTGAWLTSPYMLYYGKSPVLSLRPSGLLRNLPTIWAPGLADTMLSAFPLVIPLSFVGILEWRRWDRDRRRSAALLFGLFWVIALGYTAQPERSTSPVGDRYYYEPYFAAVILAVVTFDALLKRFASSQWPRRLLAVCLLSVAAVQIFVYRKLSVESRQPYYRMEQAAHAVHERNAIVYLAGGDFHFYSAWLNLNEAAWQQSPVLFLRDPGAGARDKLAAMLRRNRWIALGWDWHRNQVVQLSASQDGPAHANRTP